MRIDLGLILGIFLEYIIFIYYADSLFYRKRKRILYYSITGFGYILHLIFCISGNVTVNTITFGVINFIILMDCYNTDYKNAIFHSILLLFLQYTSESSMIFLLDIKVDVDSVISITPQQSLILTLTSKIFYFILTLIITKLILKDRNKAEGYKFYSGLIFIPVMTLIFIFIIERVSYSSISLSSICLLLLFINIIIFAANESMFLQNKKIQMLKDETLKNKLDLESYRLIKEKYELTEVMRHDFKKKINVLNSLISQDNEKAQEYLKSLGFESRELNIAEYTDNTILNILLSEKVEECHEENIELFINSTYPILSFIEESDMVAIFSNLFSNAIEGCKNSVEKNIFIDLFSVNNNYTIIKIENNADIKPSVLNGILQTHKADKRSHGIGMKSIKRALKPYDGQLEWEYNSKTKMFRTVISLNVINNLKKKKEKDKKREKEIKNK